MCPSSCFSVTFCFFGVLFILTRIFSVFLVYWFVFFFFTFLCFLLTSLEESLDFGHQPLPLAGISRRELPGGQVVQGTECNGHHRTGETDDIVGHAKVGGGEGNQESLCVKPQEEGSGTVRKAAIRNNILL